MAVAFVRVRGQAIGDAIAFFVFFGCDIVDDMLLGSVPFNFADLGGVWAPLLDCFFGFLTYISVWYEFPLFGAGCSDAFDGPAQCR